MQAHSQFERNVLTNGAFQLLAPAVQGEHQARHSMHSDLGELLLVTVDNAAFRDKTVAGFCQAIRELPVLMKILGQAGGTEPVQARPTLKSPVFMSPPAPPPVPADGLESFTPDQDHRTAE